MEEKNLIFQWGKEHMTELTVAGITIISIACVIKNKGLFIKDKNIQELDKIEANSIHNEVIVPETSADSMKDLTGNYLTATKLGKRVFCSAQAINKRIVEKGLATRLPSGQYMMTKSGKKFGKDTWKTNSAGHSFTNIEWDEKVLDILFTPEELAEIAIGQEK